MNIYFPRVKYIVSIFLMNSMISAAALISVFPSFLGVEDQTDFVAAAAQAQPQSQSELKEQNTTTNNLDPGSALRLFEANIAIDLPLSKGYIDGNIAYFIVTFVLIIISISSRLVSVGSKILAIASMMIYMICMMFKDEINIKPYYAVPKRYETIPIEQETVGLEKIVTLPEYKIETTR
jgi:hypothetical protein